MTLPRITIAALMTMIAVIALNVAAAHSLWTFHPRLLMGVALSGCALQLAFYALIRRRGRVRIFCAGFVAAGALSVWLFIRTCIRPFALPPYQEPSLAQTPSSPMSLAWFSDVFELCHDWPYELLGRLPYISDIANVDDAAGMTVGAILTFLPQLLASLAGGMLALFVAWAITFHRRRNAVQAAQA